MGMAVPRTHEIADAPVSFTCDDCGQESRSRDVDWVAHARAIHRCPTPEQIAEAMRNEYERE